MTFWAWFMAGAISGWLIVAAIAITMLVSEASARWWALYWLVLAAANVGFWLQSPFAGLATLGIGGWITWLVRWDDLP